MSRRNERGKSLQMDAGLRAESQLADGSEKVWGRVSVEQVPEQRFSIRGILGRVAVGCH
jgi:hypothetical protein